jgi:predicted alpha/beta-fold hydrolase
MRSFIQNLMIKNASILKALARGGSKLKALIFIGLILFYFYRKSSMRRISKIYRKTDRNRQLVEHLKPIMATFRPSIFLPTALSQIIYGNATDKTDIVKYETQPLSLPDGEEIKLEWHPLEYASMPPATPIVAFILGACGSSSENYCRVITRYVRNFGWRIVVINRRGFANQRLKTRKFMCKNETEDIHHALIAISEIFDHASIYLLGVSAGANNSAKYLGVFDETTPVNAYCSISNPYNFGRISYSMKFDFWGNLFSRFIANNFKKIAINHLSEPQFREFIESNYKNIDFVLEEMQNLDTCWKLDKFLTSKLCGKLTRHAKHLRVLRAHLLRERGREHQGADALHQQSRGPDLHPPEYSGGEAPQEREHRFSFGRTRWAH